MKAINNRKDAAKALLKKFSDQYWNTPYYKSVIGEWMNADLRKLYKTTANARREDGISYDHMVEHATVNAFGYVFVNGKNCGHMG